MAQTQIQAVSGRFILRKAEPADMAAIMSIENNSFAATVREKESTFAERMTVFPDGFLVMEEPAAHPDARIAGYFVCELWNSVKTERACFELGHSAALSHSDSGSILYISSIALDPARRGRGTGKELFRGGAEYVAKKYPHIAAMQLLVNEDWTGARRIYINEGFKETGRFTDFFKRERAGADGRNTSDGIIMEKTL